VEPANLDFEGSLEMKKTIFLAILVQALGGCASLLEMSVEHKEKSIAIQHLVAEIQSALALVDETVKQETNLTLNNAVLIINTEIGKSKEGEADLWVVSGKASRERLSSDKVTIKLIPVPIGPAAFTVKSSEAPLSERLAMSIVAAVEGVSDVGTGQYPMELSNLTIEMGITTKTVASVGAGFDFEVIPISVGGKGTRSRANLDLLRLEFSKNE
jgi:hypothetical protein